MSIRDKILEYLNSPDYTPKKYRELLEYFNAEDTAFRKIIEEMEDEGLIYKSRRKLEYISCSRNDLLKAHVTRITRNFALAMVLESDGSSQIYRINDHESFDILYHDDILINPIDDQFANFFMLIKHNLNNIVGEVVYGHPFYFIPDDKNFEMRVNIPDDKLNGAKGGQKVAINITKTVPYYEGEVTNVIGFKNAPHVDMLSLIYQASVPTKFPDEVNTQVATIPPQVIPSDLIGRVDCSKHLIVTIDGEDAKDFDDAIQTIKNTDGTYTLKVHIADVSHYVTKLSPLDKEAFKRGTSIYLVDTVIPMLPFELSNGICSLNPNEIRLTMSCDMVIDQTGEIKDYKIYESYISSKHRLTYTQVNAFFKGEHEYPADLAEMLTSSKELATIIRKNHEQRGALDLDVAEARVITNEDGVPTDVVLRERGEAERMIEDFMIAANETVASHIYWQHLPFIYRIHDLPKMKKMDQFKNLIKPMGYYLKGDKNGVHPKELQSLLSRTEDKPEHEIIASLMLRSLAKAKYDVQNVGHFGLASQCYTHFTSPIRRYPDLLVHRMLKYYSKPIENYNESDLIAELEYLAIQSSNNERRAIELERDVEDMKKAEYMTSKIGELFVGKVSGIINSGFFVELENTIEGMVRFETMDDDYYEFDEKRMIAIGRGTKKIIKLGDSVKVKLFKAEKSTGQIEFITLKKKPRRYSYEESR